MVVIRTSRSGGSRGNYSNPIIVSSTDQQMNTPQSSTSNATIGNNSHKRQGVETVTTIFEWRRTLQSNSNTIDGANFTIRSTDTDLTTFTPRAFVMTVDQATGQFRLLDSLVLDERVWIQWIYIQGDAGVQQRGEALRWRN